MTETTKFAAIIAGGIIAAVGLYIYFSPYQSCVRNYRNPSYDAHVACTVLQNLPRN